MIGTILTIYIMLRLFNVAQGFTSFLSNWVGFLASAMISGVAAFVLTRWLINRKINPGGEESEPERTSRKEPESGQAGEKKEETAEEPYYPETKYFHR